MAYKLYTDKQETFECDLFLEGADLKQEPLKDGFHDHGCDMIRYFFINRFPIKQQQLIVRKR